jgi:hypothetical protein
MNCGVGPVVRMCYRTLALLLTLAAAAQAQERVIAVGDIHGSFPQFVHILQRTGLIDAQLQWVGGSAVLVQPGDVPDRGPQTRQCLDLLMELERQAVTQHGRVIPLLGNHEVMVMMGDLRYVLPEEFQSFATDQSEKVRERAYEEYRGFVAERRRRQPSARGSEPSRQKWMAEHPPGFFEYRDALGPKGVYGRWLRQHDAVAQVEDVLFLHAGLSPGLKVKSIEKLNRQIRSELARFDSLWQSLSERGIIWRYMTLGEATGAIQEELAATAGSEPPGDADTTQLMQAFLAYPSWVMVSSDGPLWYRGYTSEPEEKLASSLDSILSRLKVRRIVAAHTITDSRRILSRCDHRVFLIDTGMLLERIRQGRASALVIQDGGFTAYYSDGETQTLVAPEGGREKNP